MIVGCGDNVPARPLPVDRCPCDAAAPEVPPADADGGTGDLAPTPQCGEQGPDTPTKADIEGPFYRAGAPSDAVLLEPADPGVRLFLQGRVMGTCRQLLAGAVIDVWQADNAGAYDAVGFHFRGTMTSGAGGEYRLETIKPGRYLNGPTYRPAHIHVKVTAPGYVPLTTQLYFDDEDEEPFNLADPWFNQALALALTGVSGGVESTFDFVLPPA
jgi:protocatechuate 3,4-dioxygenase beta subunit